MREKEESRCARTPRLHCIWSPRSHRRHSPGSSYGRTLLKSPFFHFSLLVLFSSAAPPTVSPCEEKEDTQSRGKKKIDGQTRSNTRGRGFLQKAPHIHTETRAQRRRRSPGSGYIT
jgi:hypothetical protein